MINGSEIFKRAVAIMDEQSDTGEAEWADTQDYQNRAVPILNTLAQELYPYSDTFSVEEAGIRPVLSPISALSDYIDLDDVLAGTVLPYGLAAHLAMDDNPAIASFCQQRYEELIKRFRQTIPAAWDTVTDAYGGITMGRFARW